MYVLHQIKKPEEHSDINLLLCHKRKVFRYIITMKEANCDNENIILNLSLPKDSLTGKYALTTNIGVPTT